MICEILCKVYDAVGIAEFNNGRMRWLIRWREERQCMKCRGPILDTKTCPVTCQEEQADGIFIEGMRNLETEDCWKDTTVPSEKQTQAASKRLQLEMLQYFPLLSFKMIPAYVIYCIIYTVLEFLLCFSLYAYCVYGSDAREIECGERMLQTCDLLTLRTYYFNLDGFSLMLSSHNFSHQILGAVTCDVARTVNLVIGRIGRG